MFAIVETGGKQYKVTVGQTIDVERIEANVGESIALERVLMISDGDTTRVGQPIVDNVRVAATVLEHGKGPKQIVFKFRPKQRYQRKKGHRQQYTRLRIDAIEVDA